MTGIVQPCKNHTRLLKLKTHILVAVMLKMLLVSVIRQHVLRVVLPEPLGFLNVKAAGLGLHLLSLPAPRNRRGES